jgi:hypothetical protein
MCQRLQAKFFCHLQEGRSRNAEPDRGLHSVRYFLTPVFFYPSQHLVFILLNPRPIPPVAWKSVCCDCCVLSGWGLCDELITRPEESYRLWCVVVCDIENSWMRRSWPTGGLLHQKETDSTTRQSQFSMCLRKLSSNGNKYTFWSIYPIRKAAKITNTIIPSVMRESSGKYSNYLPPASSATRPVINKYDRQSKL